MNSVAPTSMPRVGWAASRIFGSWAISRASSAFCRLPPDSVPVRASGPEVRMSKRSIWSLANLRIALRSRMPRFEKGGPPTQGSAMLSDSDSAPIMPMVRRSSGTRPMPCACTKRGVSPVTTSPCDLDGAAGRRQHAGDDIGERPLAVAGDAGDADDLAGAERQRHVLEAAAPKRR